MCSATENTFFIYDQDITDSFWIRIIQIRVFNQKALWTSYLVLLFLLIIELGNTKSGKAPDDCKIQPV